MPKKKCGLGFDCASMMQYPGIDSSDCLQQFDIKPATEIVNFKDVKKQII